jgi:ketosteroid isomerase-like protein
VTTTPLRNTAFWTRDGAGEWRVAAWVITGGGPNPPAVAPRGCESPTYASYGGFPKTSVAAGRAALLAVDSAFSARSVAEGGGPSFGAYVADDGAVLGGEKEMACGRSAVTREFSSIAPGALAWQPRIADIAASGDLGFTVGVATFTGRTQTTYTKYLTVWKRQRSGEWRFVADGGNGAPAP